MGVGAGMIFNPRSLAEFGFTAGDYVLPEGTAVALVSRTPSTSAQAVAWPFRTGPAGNTFDRAGIALITAQAGALMRMGAYTNLAGRPSTLIADWGQLDLSTGGGTDMLLTISTFIPAGIFWVVTWLQAVATQCSGYGSGATMAAAFMGQQPITTSQTVRSYLSVNSAYPGAMPAAAPAVTFSTQAVICPQLRILT